MLIDMPWLLIFLLYYSVYTVCSALILNGNYSNASNDLKLVFFPHWQEFDSLNQTMLVKYINRMMFLLIVDVLSLAVKCYYAIKTLVARGSNPKHERRYFNQYFLTSVCYYLSSMLKYALIFISFHEGYEVVHCYFVTALMSTGIVGCVVFIPCIFVALKDADQRHIILVKGAMRHDSKRDTTGSQLNVMSFSSVDDIID